MSEQGWKDFLAAEGVDDWVVLHGGATAVFRIQSVGEGARLAEALAEVAGSRRLGGRDHDRGQPPHRAADPRHVAA